MRLRSVLRLLAVPTACACAALWLSASIADAQSLPSVSKAAGPATGTAAAAVKSAPAASPAAPPPAPQRATAPVANAVSSTAGAAKAASSTARAAAQPVVQPTVVVKPSIPPTLANPVPPTVANPVPPVPAVPAPVEAVVTAVADEIVAAVPAVVETVEVLVKEQTVELPSEPDVDQVEEAVQTVLPVEQPVLLVVTPPAPVVIKLVQPIEPQPMADQPDTLDALEDVQPVAEQPQLLRAVDPIEQAPTAPAVVQPAADRADRQVSHSVVLEQPTTSQPETATAVGTADLLPVEFGIDFVAIPIADQDPMQWTTPLSLSPLAAATAFTPSVVLGQASHEPTTPPMPFEHQLPFTTPVGAPGTGSVAGFGAASSVAAPMAASLGLIAAAWHALWLGARSLLGSMILPSLAPPG